MYGVAFNIKILKIRFSKAISFILFKIYHRMGYIYIFKIYQTSKLAFNFSKSLLRLTKAIANGPLIRLDESS